MITERSLLPDFVTNTYLVADKEGGTAFFVDAGGPVAPLIERAKELDVTVTHVLLTHHHYDHVCDLQAVVDAYPGVEVLSNPSETALLEDQYAALVTGEVLPGERLTIGELEIDVLHTPGHTLGMLSLHVGGEVFTGDTLFKNSVGGVRAPGHTTFADIKHSIMEVLLALPPETVIRPGHTDPTTVADEWEHNSFVRIWRGLDPEGSAPCKALDEDATLIHLGDDYDGGHKAWVRWPDGSDDIVPGSKIEQL
ncbi:MBL fold metallo-hydrolase [Paraconexibacter algicola]|uniref:MBL fold metallo-hydrolase n=1 Tax=Paraconexibacter algicola TaxID=2133960 RepID=UPI001304B1D3|nr:MBL fold metallo-hydrolase [Paraconexibacter algicola]